MQIVINIPDKIYKKVQDGMLNDLDSMYICGAVAEGTPLPKGHGRLIDADAVTKSSQVFKESFVVNTINGVSTGVSCLAPTILEADEEIADENTT